MQVQFKEWLCDVHIESYANKRKAICLTDAEDGSPIATASINVPDADIADDEVIVKDYSENKGMLDALVDAGVVSPPTGHVNSGFITAPVCKLLIE